MATKGRDRRHRAVEARHHARLQPARENDHLVSVGVGADGTAVALWANGNGTRALQKVHDGSFAARRVVPVDVRVTWHVPGLARAVEVRGVEAAFPLVQPMPGDEVLVVGGRCPTPPDGSPNAWLFDAEGELRATAPFGDGVEHVLATPSGHVWVGYFDEGVVGSFPEGVGSTGLGRWSPDLRPVWPTPRDAATAYTDCYALNVAGEDVWTCAYPDFDVDHLTPDRVVRRWRNDIGGATALLVDQGHERVALVGGYSGATGRVVTGGLADGRFETTATLQLLVGGEVLGRQHRLIARGPILHVVRGHDWYVVDLDDL